MVASGQADLAAVDCVSWAHFRRHDSKQVSALRVLGWTPRSPSLPFITALATDQKSVAVLVGALEALRLDNTLKGVRQELLLEAVEPLDGEPYKEVLQLQRDAAALHYHTLQ